MALRTANVLARIEPEVKEKAESIMSELGIPASVVINMLYKQIILTNSIPFPLSIPASPAARDEMNTIEFDDIMKTGLTEAKADYSRPASDVFTDLKQEI